MKMVPISESLTLFRCFLQRLTGKNRVASFIAAAFLNFRELKRPLSCGRFLHIFCPCFDNVFAPLGLISRTSNKIVEIVVTSECYLIINPFEK